MNKIKSRMGWLWAAVMLVGLVVTSVTAKAADAPASPTFSFDTFAQVRTTDFNDHQGAVGIGGNLWLGENIGVRAEAVTYDRRDRFIDELNGSLVYRIPVGNATPYFFAGGGYQFEVDDYSLHLGAGLSHRLFGSGLALFGDARFEKRLDTGQSAGIGRAGIAYGF